MAISSSSSALHRLWVGQLVRDQSSCDRGIALYERRPISSSMPTSYKGKQKEVVAPLPPVVQPVARRTTRSHSANLPTPPSSQRPSLFQPSTSSRTTVPSPTEKDLIVIGQESSPPIKKAGQRQVSNDRRGALPPSSPPSQPTALPTPQPDQFQADEEEDAERLPSLLGELLDERLEAKLELDVHMPQPLSALEAAHIHLRSVDSDLLRGIEIGNDGPPAEWPYDSSATGQMHKLLKTGEVDGRTSHFLEYRIVIKGDDLNFSRATRALVYGWGGSLETREMRLFVKILTREELLRFKRWGPDAPSPILTLVDPPTQGSLSRSLSNDNRSSPSNSDSLLVDHAPEEEDVLSQSDPSDSAPPPPQRSLYKNPHDRNRPLKDRLAGVRLPIREGVWSRPSTSSSRNKGKQREVQRPPSPAMVTWPPRVGLKRTSVELERAEDWENRKRTKKDVRDGGVDSWRETVDRMTSSAEKSKVAQKGKGRVSKSSGKKKSDVVPSHVEVVQNPPPETNGQINRRTVASVTLAQVLAFEERGGTWSSGMLQATSGAACYALRSVVDGDLLSREAVGPTVANVLFLFTPDCEKDKLAVRSEFANILAGQVPPTFRTKEKSTADVMEVDEPILAPSPSPENVETVSVSVVPEIGVSAVDQETYCVAEDSLALSVRRPPTPIPEAPLAVELGKPSLNDLFHLAYPGLKLPRIHDPVVAFDYEQPALPVDDRTTDLRSPLALPTETDVPSSEEAFVETNRPPPCKQVLELAVAPDDHSPVDPLPIPQSPSPVARPLAKTLASAHVPEIELPPVPIDIPLVEYLSVARARSPTPPVLQKTVPVPETRPSSPAPAGEIDHDALPAESFCSPLAVAPEPQVIDRVVMSPPAVKAQFPSPMIDAFADDSDSDLTSVGSDDEGYDLEDEAAEKREHIEEEEWVNSQPCSLFAHPFLRGSSPLTPAPSPAPMQQSVDSEITPFRRTLRSSAVRHLDSTARPSSSSSVKSSAHILTPMDPPRQDYLNAASSGTLLDFTPPPRRSARRASVLKPLRLSPTTPATPLPSPTTTTLHPTASPASPAEHSVVVNEDVAKPDDEEKQVDLGASFVETIGRHGEKVYLLSRRSREGTAFSQGSSYRG